MSIACDSEDCGCVCGNAVERCSSTRSLHYQHATTLDPSEALRVVCQCNTMAIGHTDVVQRRR
jgi:hypothetical protein